MKILALAGGVGAARFLSGLAAVAPARDLTVVVNTGDDFEWHGLWVSPDLDTVVYTLAGIASPENGWGISGDTFTTLARLEELGFEPWFRIGDRDLATHLVRTSALRSGATLSEATRRLVRRHRIEATIAPMSDTPVPTLVHTREGTLAFQDYFVRRRCEPAVARLSYQGAGAAEPAPGILDAIAGADGIVICPSNPFLSIGPILAIRGMREAIAAAGGRVAAISPIIAGRAVKGPTAGLLAELGHEVSALAVARIYRDLVDVFVLDRLDAALEPEVAALGIEPRTAETLMDGAAARAALARTVLEALA
jgi:LPPG:FO 2-phospho-L-lactate transferase